MHNTLSRPVRGCAGAFLSVTVENMKSKIIITITIIALLATDAMAFVTIPFTDWQHVVDSSMDICIVSCEDPTPPPLGSGFKDPVIFDSQVFIVSTLKGTNNVNSRARFITCHELVKDRSYLIFAMHDDNGILQAYEEYRVVPLVRGFRPNMLDGKNTFDEKLQFLFQNGVDAMNQKIQDDEKERDRLQEAVQK
jgi:hypothetical protein